MSEARNRGLIDTNNGGDPAHPRRLIPYGDFEVNLVSNDPNKGVKIVINISDLARKQLKAYLRENTYMFAWSATENPELDLEVACPQLTIEPVIRAIAQCKGGKQSLKNAEVAEKVVKNL